MCNPIPMYLPLAFFHNWPLSKPHSTTATKHIKSRSKVHPVLLFTTIVMCWPWIWLLIRSKCHLCQDTWPPSSQLRYNVTSIYHFICFAHLQDCWTPYLIVPMECSWTTFGGAESCWLAKYSSRASCMHVPFSSTAFHAFTAAGTGCSINIKLGLSNLDVWPLAT